MTREAYTSVRGKEGKEVVDGLGQVVRKKGKKGRGDWAMGEIQPKSRREK